MTEGSLQNEITTILPTYRRPALLGRAIRSVLAQTCPNFVLRVYDNASGDATERVVAEFSRGDPRVRYHRHSENLGALRNMQYGLRQVETPYYSILSDDDILLPDFYETALDGFRRHPEAAFSATAVVHMDDRGRIHRSPEFSWEPGLHAPPAGLRTMLERGHPVWTGTLFRKELIAELGPLDPEVGPIADLDFELRAAARFPFVVTRKPGAIFTIHPDSLWETRRLDTVWPGWLKIIRNLAGEKALEESDRAHAREVLTQQIKRTLFTMGFECCARANYVDARKIARILKTEFAQGGRAFLVYAAARLWRFVPGLSALFRLALAARRGLRGHHRQIPPEYRQDYARFLRA